jgi:hypothetical protein
VTRIALGHHICWFKSRVGDLSNGQLLVVSLFSRNDWSIRTQHKVDTWIGHQVGLELSNIHVQSTIETKRCC